MTKPDPTPDPTSGSMARRLAEGWRCFRCGQAYPLGTPRCGPCAAALARAVGELRSLRTGLPPHLTTFDVSPADVDPDSATSTVSPGGDAGEPASRVDHLVRLLRGGQALSGDSVARVFGCSPRTGRRLLAEAHEALASEGG